MTVRIRPLGDRAAGAAVIGVVAVAMLGIAGCGDDNDETASVPATTTGGATAALSGTVDVSETDFALDPSDPVVKAGTVTFKVTNDGQTVHSLEVEGPGEESELKKELQPGDSGTLKVKLNKPGKYEWYCPVANHKAMGMKGTITVQ
jgi:uncharacterized cupredoxin-like copper-binding protein